jgi:hypothetical protein
LPLPGVTTVNDMFCHTNMGSLASLGVVDGLEAISLRGVVCFGDVVRFGADRPGLANVHDPASRSSTPPPPPTSPTSGSTASAA